MHAIIRARDAERQRRRLGGDAMILHRIDLDTLAQATYLIDTINMDGRYHDVSIADGTGAVVLLDEHALAVLAQLDEQDDGYYESIGARVFIGGRDYPVVRYQTPGWHDLTLAQQDLLGDAQEAADYAPTTALLLDALAEADAPAGDKAMVRAYLTGRPASA